jgi:hypothetical protein
MSVDQWQDNTDRTKPNVRVLGGMAKTCLKWTELDQDCDDALNLL